MSEPRSYMTVYPEGSIVQKRTAAFNTFHANKHTYNISDDQINELFRLQYKGTEDFVFIEDKNTRDMIYQIIGIFSDNIYREIIDIVKNTNVTDLHSLYYKLSIFDIPKRKINVEIDNIRDVMEVEDGAYVCNECSSSRTFSSSKQMASADEASTIFVVCAACGHSWRTRG